MRFPVLSLLVLSLALTACGGGGGADGADGGQPKAAVTGLYHMSAAAIVSSEGTTTYAGAVDIQGDPADAIAAFDLTENRSGVIDPDADEPMLARWSPDGAFVLRSIPDLYRGFASRDGSFVWFTSLVETGTPTLGVLVRATATDPGDTVGTWKSVRMFHNPSLDLLRVTVSDTVLASDGTGRRSPGGLNENGVSGPSPVTNLTHRVEAGGRVIFDFLGGTTIEGGMDPSRSMMALAGAREAGSVPQLEILVRATSGASAEDAAGRWRVGSIHAMPGTAISTRGVLDLSSAGSGTVEVTSFDGVAETDLPPQPVSFTVAPDGTVDLVIAGTTMRGALSPDRNTMVLGGAVQGGGLPSIYVLVRD